MEEMGNDLKRLFDEGEMLDGDERSKKICNMLDDWLKRGLKMASKEALFTRHLIRHIESNEINGGS